MSLYKPKPKSLKPGYPVRSLRRSWRKNACMCCLCGFAFVSVYFVWRHGETSCGTFWDPSEDAQSGQRPSRASLFQYTHIISYPTVAWKFHHGRLEYGFHLKKRGWKGGGRCHFISRSRAKRSSRTVQDHPIKTSLTIVRPPWWRRSCCRPGVPGDLRRGLSKQRSDANPTTGWTNVPLFFVFCCFVFNMCCSFLVVSTSACVCDC